MRRIRGSKDFNDLPGAHDLFESPSSRVGYQIGKVIELHQGLSKKEAFQKTVETLGLVGIPSPETRAMVEVPAI